MNSHKVKGMRGWTELCSDVNWEDYGGMWARQARDGKWYVVQFTNMYDACGERDCKDGNVDQYEAQVKMLDLASLSEKDLARALSSSGFVATPRAIEHEHSGEVVSDDPETIEIIVVECCIQHGFGAPLDSFTGNVRPANVRAQARRTAEEYMRDAIKLDAALDRPVNAIGSTAREYGVGDIDSALVRGDSDMHRLMRKMHGMPEDAADIAPPRATVVVMRQSDLRAYPFCIMVPEHYREDGSCKCDDVIHRIKMKQEWGYSEKDFKRIPLRA